MIHKQTKQKDNEKKKSSNRTNNLIGNNEDKLKLMKMK